MKLKNIKHRLVLIVLSVLFFCFLFICPSIITAFAEEESNGESITKNEEVYPQSYLFQISDTEDIAITLTDEKNASFMLVVNKAFSGDPSRATYTLNDDIITLFVDGEIYGVYNRSIPYGSNFEDDKENNENVVESETIDKVLTDEQIEQVKGFVQKAYDKVKNKLMVVYTFLMSTTLGGVIVLACSILWKKCKKKINKENILTEYQIKAIATDAAATVVKSIVGKSLNVDIQSEVSESVKSEIAPMAKNMEIAMQSAKNAEVGTALVLKAQAKSHLISESETAEMESRADSLLAHAEKFGGLSVPIQIQTHVKEEKQKKAARNLVEIENKPVEKKDNESYISF